MLNAAEHLDEYKIQENAKSDFENNFTTS